MTVLKLMDSPLSYKEVGLSALISRSNSSACSRSKIRVSFLPMWWKLKIMKGVNWVLKQGDKIMLYVQTHFAMSPRIIQQSIVSNDFIIGNTSLVVGRSNEHYGLLSERCKLTCKQRQSAETVCFEKALGKRAIIKWGRRTSNRTYLKTHDILSSVRRNLLEDEACAIFTIRSNGSTSGTDYDNTVRRRLLFQWKPCL